MSNIHLDTARHPITEGDYVAECRTLLDRDGALVLRKFARSESITRIIHEVAPREVAAHYTSESHNVYLTEAGATYAEDHPHNLQVSSNKGLIADDEIPLGSPLREIYDDVEFREFLAGVLGINEVYPYADHLSPINVNFAAEGMELGWHFDNSPFAVTMLLQATDGGAEFEYVGGVRNADAGDMAYDRVASILSGAHKPDTLSFEPGDLVLFRGRNAIHRVTPAVGDTTRILVVFAYGDGPGITLSESALRTFYGRIA